VKVAAWQMPIGATAVDIALVALREQVRHCEDAGVTVLCCPEGAIGGLADDVPEPADIAIATGDVDATFASIASDRVTVIVGFTELHSDGRLYNAAAVVRKGAVTGIYRKVYPAIHRSVYEPGRALPVFAADDLTFGIVICNDSNYLEPARVMARKGVTVLFVPTNNSLPAARRSDGMTDEARACDIARAVENTVWVVRADVAGRTATHTAQGSTGVVDPNGRIRHTAQPFEEDLLMIEIKPRPPTRRRGWDAGRNPAVVTEYRARWLDVDQSE
jgi:predicted amidohydrolase